MNEVTEKTKEEYRDILAKDIDIDAYLSACTDEEIMAMFQKNEKEITKIVKEMNTQSRQKYIAYPRHPFR